ncbi:MAG: hypothetical protein AAGD40_10205 [Pseudomonadota bacterium]
MDVVVCLFAIMLVVLIALTAATAVSESVSDLEYQTAEPEADAFMLRSIQAPYRNRDLWIVGADDMIRIDKTAISRRAADLPPRPNLAVRGPGAVVDIERLGGTSWKMSITLTDRAEADWLIAERIELTDQTALEAWAAEQTPVVVALLKDGHGQAAPLSDLMRGTLKPHEIFVYTMDNPQIIASYHRGNFAHERILRVY